MTKVTVKSLDLIKYLDEVSSDLITKLKNLAELRKISNSRNETTNIKLGEVFDKKLSSIDKQRQMNIHLERNNAVYKAYGNIVESIKFKSEKLEEQANSVSHILGLKYSIEENSDSSTIEVRVDFKEEKSFYVKFIYDLQTDDFDLIEMNPVHQNFYSIKNFLRDTGDTQGFLYTVWIFLNSIQ